MGGGGDYVDSVNENVHSGSRATIDNQTRSVNQALEKMADFLFSPYEKIGLHKLITSYKKLSNKIYIFME